MPDEKMYDYREPIKPDTKVTFSQADFHDVVPPRQLTQWEWRLVERLLSKPSDSRDELLQQLDSVRVTAECLHCPSIELAVDEKFPNEALTSHGARHLIGLHEKVSELSGKDVDGMEVWALLFVQEGKLVELEVLRADGRPFLSLPDPESFELL